MTPEQEAAIRARHVKGVRTVGIMFSEFRPGAADALRDVEVCDGETGEYIVEWPCDTAQVLAALDAARAAIEVYKRLVEFVGEADQAILDAFEWTENNRVAHEEARR